MRTGRTFGDQDRQHGNLRYGNSRRDSRKDQGSREMKLTGKCSWFGGPDDDGVSPSEGLAFIYDVSDQPDLFLPSQPPGTTGLARRLDPDEYYIACRWTYEGEQSKSNLLKYKALVRSPKTGKEFYAFPADWGPHQDTGRVADLSPSLLADLGLTTDDTVEVIFPAEEIPPMTIQSVVISSGHGLKVRGASGILDEVDEARKVVPKVAEYLQALGLTVYTFNDDTSTTQNQNLETICNYHNSKQRDLDISVHFNCYEQTNKDMGTECLYVTQDDLSAEVAGNISEVSGLVDRGPKYRSDLYFLNNTNKPAILIEVCFIDSQADCDKYQASFDKICQSIAETVAGKEVAPIPPEPEPEPEPGPEQEVVTITMKIEAPDNVTVRIKTVQE